MIADATQRADTIAAEVRCWYEANRESWWTRRLKHWTYCADNFMLGLVEVVYESVKRHTGGPWKSDGIAKALAIIARRKKLANEGKGLMQFSEYDEIERLLTPDFPPSTRAN